MGSWCIGIGNWEFCGKLIVRFMQERKRNSNIDVLRALGLLLIILAHVHAPFSLHQFRSFDVPMMMFVSGLAMAVHPQSAIGGWVWLWKRVKRLVFPVWIFLGLYFVFLFLAHKVVAFHLPTFPKMVESFLLLDGIGYVWVIRVFLILAVLTPFLLIFYEKIKKNGIVLFLALILWGGIQSILCYLAQFVMNIPAFLKLVYEQYFLYMAYAIPFLLGLHLGIRKLQSWRLYLCLALIAVIFLFLYIFQHGLPITISPDYKYPPQSYYLVWGCFMSVVCWLIVRKWSRILQNRFLVFVGQNTIWIYLWHIPLVQFANKFCDIWWLKWIGITLIAVGIYSVQQKVVSIVEMRYGKLSFCRYLKG